jgi:hypothetical protein
MLIPSGNNIKYVRSIPAKLGFKDRKQVHGDMKKSLRETIIPEPKHIKAAKMR